MPFKDPERRRANQKRWRENHPDRTRHYDTPENKRVQHLNRKYGITIERYNEMLVGQGGVCKICRRADPDGRHLAVDHDHETGKIRGLLCRPCNTALGLMFDDPKQLRIAADYVEKAV